MSRTKGHSDPRRSEADFFETPEWCVRAICEWLHAHSCVLQVSETEYQCLIPYKSSILDPGSGTGAITGVLREEWPMSYIEGVEVDHARVVACREAVPVLAHPDGQSTNIVEADFLTAQDRRPGEPFDLCVCNPPFSGPHREDLALAFIERAMSMSKVGAFLVRLNWLAAAPTKQKLARYKYLKAHPPCVLVMGKRPIFRGEHGDSCEYCWLVFGLPGTEGRWELLDCGGGKPC